MTTHMVPRTVKCSPPKNKMKKTLKKQLYFMKNINALKTIKNDLSILFFGFYFDQSYKNLVLPPHFLHLYIHANLKIALIFVCLVGFYPKYILKIG